MSREYIVVDFVTAKSYLKALLHSWLTGDTEPLAHWEKADPSSGNLLRKLMGKKPLAAH